MKPAIAATAVTFWAGAYIWSLATAMSGNNFWPLGTWAATTLWVSVFVANCPTKAKP